MWVVHPQSTSDQGTRLTGRCVQGTSDHVTMGQSQTEAGTHSGLAPRKPAKPWEEDKEPLYSSCDLP